MQEARQDSQCSVCGAVKPREDMFGAEPDLLCESCAEGVRQRTARTPTGRMVSMVLSGRTPATVGLIGIAAVILLTGRLWARSPTDWAPWINFLTMVGATPERYVTATVVDEPWRLLTSAFLHGGVFHLLMNSWCLWVLARGVEWRRGPVILALLVIGSAVASGAAQWMFAGGTGVRPSWPGGVGLSGAVYAIAGFLWAQRKVDPIAAAIMNPRNTRILLAWLVVAVVLTEMKVLMIGNWAHGMGAVWGLAAGFGAQGRYRYVWLSLLGLSTAGLVALVMSGKVFW